MKKNDKFLIAALHSCLIGLFAFGLLACDDSGSGAGGPSTGESGLESDGKSGNGLFADVNDPNVPWWTKVKSKDDFLNPDIDYGEFVDYRDNRVYKTVQIGEQVWMAENLKYKKFCYCYDENEKYCEISGCFYHWMYLTLSYTTGKVQKNEKGHIVGVCPEGWHLPSEHEWRELLTTVGGKFYHEWTDGLVEVERSPSQGGYVYLPSKILKSRLGMNEGDAGTDDFGFSAISAGYYDSSTLPEKYDTGCLDDSCTVFLWMSTAYGSDERACVLLHNGLNMRYPYRFPYSVEITIRGNHYGLNARCVKD